MISAMKWSKPGRALALLACIAAPVWLAGCATGPAQPADIASSPWARQSGVAAPTDAAWVHKTFPGKTPTRFKYARQDGRDTVSVDADASASMLRQVLRIEPAQLGRVQFSWKVPALIVEDFVPFAAASYVLARATATIGGTSDSDSQDYTEIDIGAGFVFNRTLTIRPSVAIPVGIDGAKSAFQLAFAFNFGKH